MATKNLEVARTIVDQLGFALRMIGARDLVGGPDYLEFRIGSNPKRVSHIMITLDPSDTYTVTFAHGRDWRKVTSDSGVYFDQLADTIEAHTGLYTRLV